MAAIEEYLKELRLALKDSDAATVRDALSDAEEHLRTSVAELRAEHPGLSEADAAQKAIAQYGSPAETAAAYAEVERRTGPLPQRKPESTSVLRRFFSVYEDPNTWGTLLYMLISLLTGIFYFTWVVTGLSLSISLSLFIFGLPLAILFLLSVRGLALLEGRMVEALLGERMPRRPIFTGQNLKWLERLKLLVTDRHTWLSMLYMVIQQFLGIIYFTLVIVVFTISLTLMFSPLIQSTFHQGVLTIENTRVFLPVWAFPFAMLAGFLLWTAFMHLGRGIGHLHRRYAKAMLVTE